MSVTNTSGKNKSSVSFLQGTLIAISLAVTVFAAYPVFASVMAKIKLMNSHEQVMVVSSRVKLEDAAYILTGSKNDRIQYIRSTDPFAEKLAIQFPTPQGDSTGIHFYIFENNKATRLASLEEGSRKVADVSSQQDISKNFPYIPACIVLGVGLGLLFPIRSAAVVPAFLGLSLVSGIKVLVDCPTCPKATILGINAALLGLAFFFAIGLVLLALPKTNLISKVFVVGIVSGVMLWQVYSWWGLRTQCLPCCIIGGTAGLLLTSSHFMRLDGPRFTLQPKIVSVWLVGTVMLFGIQGGFRQKAIAEVTPSRHLTALGMAKPLDAKSASDLGIHPTGKRVIVLIAASGCKACELACDTIDSMQIPAVDFYSTTSTFPDRKRTWRTLPNASIITSTPTTVLIEPDGRISKVVMGGSADMNFRQKYVTDLLDFIKPTLSKEKIYETNKNH